MTAHSVTTITIDRPRSDVFDVIQDYRIRLDWDTMLRQAYTVNDAPPDKGVVAVCAARWRLGGLVFATRYVTFRRPDLAAVTLERPYLLFEMWSASLRHQDLPDSPDGRQRSSVTYTLTLRCRPRWVARPVEAIAIRAFTLETRRRLRALKRYLEAGATTGASGLAQNSPEQALTRPARSARTAQP